MHIYTYRVLSEAASEPIKLCCLPAWFESIINKVENKEEELSERDPI
jgi:hypothetical protein